MPRLKGRHCSVAGGHRVASWIVTRAEGSGADPDRGLDCDDCAAEMLHHLTVCDAENCPVCSASTRADALTALWTMRGSCTHHSVSKPTIDDPLEAHRVLRKSDSRMSDARATTAGEASG